MYSSDGICKEDKMNFFVELTKDVDKLLPLGELSEVCGKADLLTLFLCRNRLSTP